MSNNQVKAYFKKIMAIESEMDELKEDRKELYKSAKEAGVDTKILRKVVSRARRDRHEVDEEDDKLAIYEDDCS